MSALGRILPGADGKIPKPGYGNIVESEVTRDTKRWLGGKRDTPKTPYKGPAMTGEGMSTGGPVAPLGRRATVISGNTRRTSLIGG